MNREEILKILHQCEQLDDLMLQVTVLFHGGHIPALPDADTDQIELHIRTIIDRIYDAGVDVGHPGWTLYLLTGREWYYNYSSCERIHLMEAWYHYSKDQKAGYIIPRFVPSKAQLPLPETIVFKDLDI